MRKGLYANIHAKRKRGGKMRKKGAKGAPSGPTGINVAPFPNVPSKAGN